MRRQWDELGNLRPHTMQKRLVLKTLQAEKINRKMGAAL